MNSYPNNAGHRGVDTSVGGAAHIASDLARVTDVISACRKPRYVISKVVDGVSSDWQWYTAFGALERSLADTQFLVGDALTIADIAVYAYSHRAEDCAFSLADYPAVDAWMGRVSEAIGPGRATNARPKLAITAAPSPNPSTPRRRASATSPAPIA